MVDVVADEDDVDVTVEVVSGGPVVVVVAIGTVDVPPAVSGTDSEPDEQPAANSSSADANNTPKYGRPLINDPMCALRRD